MPSLQSGLCEMPSLRFGYLRALTRRSAIRHLIAYDNKVATISGLRIILLWDSKAGAGSNWPLTMIAKYHCLGTDRLMIARGKHYKGEGEECNNSPSCGVIVLIAILNLLIFTSLPDWHEECHSGDGENHEDCIACLIVSGSIDSMISFMDVRVVRDQASQCTVYSSGGVNAAQYFWVILAPRPPPTVV